MKNICNTINKIIEEEDPDDNTKKNNLIRDRITIVDNSMKNLYVNEEEIPGKNILYADNIKITNNFEEGTFNKNLISNEN